jgi:phosphopantothenoylcysteine decarboxylase/phosphopantothenate--cysteine ligase
MSDPRRSDLTVEPISDALTGWTLDVVVSGSIGAVESVRFIRALRRLGADVIPWLTAGGSRFVTEVAIGWAAGRPVRTEFSGDASHIATGHACIIAPASANILSQVALGLTDTPASALVASYLGASLPVCAVPSMHDSLACSPAILEHLACLRQRGIEILSSRDEEGKKKFPDPACLADTVAHVLHKNAFKNPVPRVLVSMGTTRGYIDDVRYVSNYSSGALGSLVVEELHRFGFYTHVVAGPCPIHPKVFGQLTKVETNLEMAEACKEAISAGCHAAVLAASILDFAPVDRTPGKIKSAEHDQLTVMLGKQPKIIADINPSANVKVGFKLETNLTSVRAEQIAADYMQKYALSLMVINDLSDVDEKRHKAWLFEREPTQGTQQPARALETKSDVARSIARHIASRLDPR